MSSMLERIQRKKAQGEGLIVGSIYKKPDKVGELTIGDGFFSHYEIYYSIFLMAMKKKIKIITKHEIRTILNDNPHMQEEFKEAGGFEQLKKIQDLASEENLESYEQAVVKCELLIRLRKKNLITDAEIPVFAKWSIPKIEQEIQKRHVEVFSDMPGMAKLKSFTHGIRENFKAADEGDKIGFPFLCPQLTDRTAGRLLGNISIFAAATGVGKSFLSTLLLLVPNIKLKEPMTIIANEENY